MSGPLRESVDGLLGGLASRLASKGKFRGRVGVARYEGGELTVRVEYGEDAVKAEYGEPGKRAQPWALDAVNSLKG